MENLMTARTLKIVAVLFCCGIVASLHAAKPNVVLILADDLGYGELGCYGSPDAKTPVMDRLAAEGVRCTDGYSAFPVCSPSRAAILTGRYPQRFGPTYEDYFGGGAPELDPVKHVTIGQLLKDAGYRTGCFGKWNVSNLNRRRANDFGFDKWVGFHLNHDFYTHSLVRGDELDMYEDGKPLDAHKGTWSDTVFANEAIKFIKQKSDKPFFVFIPFQAPHDPIQDPDKPFAERLDKKKVDNRPILIKMIERLDTEVGRVMKALQEQGVADNTLVIVTSDNGGALNIGRNLPLSKSKQWLEEGGIRVPYILHWPGVLPAGKTCSTPVSAYDLTATIAAAGGAKAHADKPFDGVDLVPALTGKSELDAERPLFFRRRNVVARKGENAIRQSAVRKGDWKILRTYKPVGSDKYQTALYNLKNDLGETTNLASTHPEKTKALSDLLDKWEADCARTAIPFVTADKKKKK
jgi:arylsulfatase A-like enzyme